MSAVPGIIRTVQDGGVVVFDGKALQHDNLKAYQGIDVQLELEIDVETEKSYFRIYTMTGYEICLVELEDIDTIGEASNGSK